MALMDERIETYLNQRSALLNHDEAAFLGQTLVVGGKSLVVLARRLGYRR